MHSAIKGYENNEDAFAWKLRKLSTHDKNEHYFLPDNVSLIIDTQLTLYSVNEGQDVL